MHTNSLIEHVHPLTNIRFTPDQCLGSSQQMYQRTSELSVRSGDKTEINPHNSGKGPTAFTPVLLNAYLEVSVVCVLKCIQFIVVSFKIDRVILDPKLDPEYRSPG